MALIFLLQPKVIVSANCGVEPGKIVRYKPLLDGALNMISFRPNKCVIFNRPGVSLCMFRFRKSKCSITHSYLEVWLTSDPVEKVRRSVLHRSRLVKF